MTNMFAGAGQQGAVPSNATVQHGISPSARRLEVSIEDAGASTRFCLRGVLDTSSAASAYDTIVACAAAPSRRVHLDLSGVDAASRAGCRAIYVAAKLLHGRGGRMTIFGARPKVASVLKGAGFDAVFEFCDGVAPSDVACAAGEGPPPSRHREVA